MCLLQLLEHSRCGVINVAGMREHGGETEWVLFFYFLQCALPLLYGLSDKGLWQQSEQILCASHCADFTQFGIKECGQIQVANSRPIGRRLKKCV